MLQPQPFRIYLLRHAQAAWAEPGARDFDRCLNDTGREEATRIADRVRTKGYNPAMVLSSTAARCRETTEILQPAFALRPRTLYLDEMYNAQAETYLSLLSDHESVGSIMLVGHNPTMETVAEALLGYQRMEAGIPGGFPTAGLAVIEQEGHGRAWPAGCRLVDFLVP